MESNTLTGYHATARKHVKSILYNGFYMSKPNKGHWLGKGVYFFENIYFAVEWGIIGVIKKETNDYSILSEKCAILSVKINTEKYEVIDLSEPQGYEIFKMLLEIIKERYGEERYNDIIKKGDAYIIKVLEELERIQNEKYISKFDIVCADYPKNIIKKENIKGNFTVCTQKQICVKNTKAIEKIKEHNDSEEIKKLFMLNIKNRGVEND